GGLPVQFTDGVTVPEAITLTIVPGQVVKWTNGDSLLVNGTLIAESTPQLPIVFTSQHDDTAGGDANANGDTTEPRRGDWWGLRFGATSDASVLRNVAVRWAGNASSPGNGSWNRDAVLVSGSSLIMENVRIVEFDWRGLRLEGASTPTLTNVAIL